MTEQELRATAQREAKDFLELLFENGPHQDPAYPQQLLMHMLLRYHAEGAVQACDNIAARFGWNAPVDIERLKELSNRRKS